MCITERLSKKKMKYQYAIEIRMKVRADTNAIAYNLDQNESDLLIAVLWFVLFRFCEL